MVACGVIQACSGTLEENQVFRLKVQTTMVHVKQPSARWRVLDTFTLRPFDQTLPSSAELRCTEFCLVVASMHKWMETTSSPLNRSSPST